MAISRREQAQPNKVIAHMAVIFLKFYTLFFSFLSIHKRFYMKKIVSIIAASLLLCLSISSAAITLKVAHSNPENNNQHKAWLKFKELVEAGSNKEIIVQIYPAEQMGGDREVIEFVQVGTIDLASPSVSGLMGWDSAFGATGLPFTFEDRATVRKVLLETEFGTYLMKRLEPLGFKGLGWYETGWRQFSNSKRAVYTPKDMAGLKIRTMQVDMDIMAFKALGANPTPMTYGEVYSALQQGVIDGQENVLGDAISARIQEVNKHFTMTKHVYTARIVIMNPDRFASLSTEHQALIVDSVQKASEHQQAIILEEEKNYTAILKENKVEVVELTSVQRQAFKDALAPIIPELQKMVGQETFDLLQKTMVDLGK